MVCARIKAVLDSFSIVPSLITVVDLLACHFLKRFKIFSQFSIHFFFLDNGRRYSTLRSPFLNVFYNWRLKSLVDQLSECTSQITVVDIPLSGGAARRDGRGQAEGAGRGGGWFLFMLCRIVTEN